MPYIETTSGLGDGKTTKRYHTEGIIEDVTLYFYDFYDDEKYMAVREAMRITLENNPDIKDAPFISYSAAMLLHHKKIYDASAGFLEFAFSEEIAGNPMTNDIGIHNDNKITYAITYLFALEYWKNIIESERPQELDHFRNILQKRWDVICEATCLVELFKDRIGRHRFAQNELESASEFGRQFLVRAAM